MSDDIRAEALRILESLTATLFEDCIALTRNFSSLTNRYSIYAIRHRTAGLLYIGKSQNPKHRFNAGHKALVWCWFEGYIPGDVRIATYPLDYRQWTKLSLELENQIIRATEPPFNTKIPMGE